MTDDECVEAAIAAHVGLPAGRTAPRAIDGLIRLGRAEAARVLAVATSFAHDQPTPPADMAEDATLLSNGRKSAGDGIGWTPLANATFDCGVIGHDARHAFIVRVEKEDRAAAPP